MRHADPVIDIYFLELRSCPSPLSPVSYLLYSAVLPCSQNSKEKKTNSVRYLYQGRKNHDKL